MQSYKEVQPALFTIVALVAFFAVPAFAQPTTADVTSKFDDAVREAWKSGKSSRVIIRFATIADRDQAFGELLNDGAAVRIMDGETPSLNVVAAATLANIQSAEGVSYDAPVTVLSFKESA